MQFPDNDARRITERIRERYRRGLPDMDTSTSNRIYEACYTVLFEELYGAAAQQAAAEKASTSSALIDSIGAKPIHYKTSVSKGAAEMLGLAPAKKKGRKIRP